MLREKHNPYNGAFEKPGPELGSDSVYSKHNGATQNREELHIVFGSSCHLWRSWAQHESGFSGDTLLISQPTCSSGDVTSQTKSIRSIGTQVHSQQVLRKDDKT